jgi:cyclohexanone monooxygenase
MSGRRIRVLAQQLTAGKELEINAEALRNKYREERDKRLRAQDGRTGQSQYISDLAESAEWSSIAMDPYTQERVNRPPLIDKEVEVLCIGGGFGGLLSAARLRMKGIEDVWIVERGSKVGGTWYW